MQRAAPGADLDRWKPETFADVEEERADESIAGYVVLRPVNRTLREFWCAKAGRWIQMHMRHETRDQRFNYRERERKSNYSKTLELESPSDCF